MTDYDFSAKFKAAPLGAMTSEVKAIVFPPAEFGGTMYDADPGGKYYSLVDDDRLGGRCCRLRYPANEVGMMSKFFQLRIKSPKTVANIAFDYLAEDGFEFNTCPEDDVGGGKLGPCINWGEVGGATEKRGTRPMWWWNAHGSNNNAPVFSPSTQDQRSGNQLIQPVKYTKPIETERLYRFQISIMGGPEGWTKHYQDGVLIASVGPPKAMQVTADDDVLFDFAFFHGGAGDSYAATKDCFARIGNVRFWSGESADTDDAGDSDGGNGETTPPPDPGPTPTPPDDPSSRFSIAVGETKVLEAIFYDDKIYPPKKIAVTAAVKWSASPSGVLSWGASLDPMSQRIKVTGKTPAKGATCFATDPTSGTKSETMLFDVTEKKSATAIRKGKVTLSDLDE